MLDAISIDNCRLLIQTLGHSLWQASAVAVLCWLVLRSLPARKAGTRYAVTCGGLLVVVLATLMTAAAVSTSATALTNFDEETGQRSNISTSNSAPLPNEQNSVTSARPSDDHDQTEAAPPDHSAASHTVEAAVTDPVADDDRPALAISEVTRQSQHAWPALAAGVWGLGVLAMMLRLVRTIVALRKLEPCRTPADDTMLSQVRDVISELSRRMNLRWPVSLVVSDKVSVPGIVGTFWPTLLMPPAMLTGVPIEQLRIVIAHELAHAKRFDFLVNLGQLLVESFLFFNPAVWWLSRQIRIEREACCDAAAVAATGSAVPVARTLLDIVDRLTESLAACPESCCVA
jgi:beta-lactamase regulating signal transducer with metallopeptidase domain